MRNKKCLKNFFDEKFGEKKKKFVNDFFFSESVVEWDPPYEVI